MYNIQGSSLLLLTLLIDQISGLWRWCAFLIQRLYSCVVDASRRIARLYWNRWGTTTPSSRMRKDFWVSSRFHVFRLYFRWYVLLEEHMMAYSEKSVSHQALMLQYFIGSLKSPLLWTRLQLTFNRNIFSSNTSAASLTAFERGCPVFILFNLKLLPVSPSHFFSYPLPAFISAVTLSPHHLALITLEARINNSPPFVASSFVIL